MANNCKLVEVSKIIENYPEKKLEKNKKHKLIKNIKIQRNYNKIVEKKIVEKL